MARIWNILLLGTLKDATLQHTVIVVSIPWLSSPQHLLQPPLHANLAVSITEDAVSLQLLLYCLQSKQASWNCVPACMPTTDKLHFSSLSFTPPFFLIILIMESAASS